MKESKVANGRTGVYVPNHPKSNNSGYIIKSRYIVENYLNRYLEGFEQVHHCNENKLDDRLENLDITCATEHIRTHRLWEKRRKLDYGKIKELRNMGMGYKKIAKKLKYPIGSTKSAIRSIER